MKSDNSYSNLRSLLTDCMFEVKARVVKEEFSGVHTGFHQLDKLIDGFEKGKVYVIGGRPCMGKEEFILSVIRNITMEQIPVLFFSTNHMKSDYVKRLLTIHCDIPTIRFQQGTLEAFEWERLDRNMGSLIEAPLFIYDSLDLPLNNLIETTHNCIKETGAKIIFIDCLQMIDFDKEDACPSEKIARVMCALKQLANQIDVPIVVGSMLGRGVEFREGLEGKQPLLMDLSNSSYIEGLADVIMMVHRPEYYCIYQDDNGRDMHGLVEILVKKNALKALGNIYLEYQQDTGIVGQEKYTNNTSSKTIGLKALETGNKAITRLIKAFGLYEELPF